MCDHRCRKRCPSLEGKWCDTLSYITIGSERKSTERQGSRALPLKLPATLAAQCGERRTQSSGSGNSLLDDPTFPLPACAWPALSRGGSLPLLRPTKAASVSSELLRLCEQGQASVRMNDFFLQNLNLPMCRRQAGQSAQCNLKRSLTYRTGADQLSIAPVGRPLLSSGVGGDVLVKRVSLALHSAGVRCERKRVVGGLTRVSAGGCLQFVPLNPCSLALVLVRAENAHHRALVLPCHSSRQRAAVPPSNCEPRPLRWPVPSRVLLVSLLQHRRRMTRSPLEALGMQDLGLPLGLLKRQRIVLLRRWHLPGPPLLWWRMRMLLLLLLLLLDLELLLRRRMHVFKRRRVRLWRLHLRHPPPAPTPAPGAALPVRCFIAIVGVLPRQRLPRLVAVIIQAANGGLKNQWDQDAKPRLRSRNVCPRRLVDARRARKARARKVQQEKVDPVSEGSFIRVYRALEAAHNWTDRVLPGERRTRLPLPMRWAMLLRSGLVAWVLSRGRARRDCRQKKPSAAG